MFTRSIGPSATGSDTPTVAGISHECRQTFLESVATLFCLYRRLEFTPPGAAHKGWPIPGVGTHVVRLRRRACLSRYAGHAVAPYPLVNAAVETHARATISLFEER